MDSKSRKASAHWSDRNVLVLHLNLDFPDASFAGIVIGWYRMVFKEVEYVVPTLDKSFLSCPNCFAMCSRFSISSASSLSSHGCLSMTVCGFSFRSWMAFCSRLSTFLDHCCFLSCSLRHCCSFSKWAIDLVVQKVEHEEHYGGL